METETFYRDLNAKQITDDSIYIFLDDNKTRLSEIESNKCEGPLSEKECTKALKDMKNPGLDDLTVEYFGILSNSFILIRKKKLFV